MAKKPRGLRRDDGGGITPPCDTAGEEDDWDFTVPQIPAPKKRLSDSTSPRRSNTTACHGEDAFNLRHLIGAIQAGETCEVVRSYLGSREHTLSSGYIKTRVNGEVDGCPAFFYVVETGNAEMVKVWASYGGDVNCTHRTIPLLGFAIVLGRSFRKDMSLVVKTLLSLDALVDVIPGAFHTPLDRDLPDGGPPADELTDIGEPGKAWCGPAVRRRMAQALNFSLGTRYSLARASRHAQSSGAAKQVATTHKSIRLLALRHFLIGQSLASGLLIERFLAHLVMPTRQPLVLMFAGPSGHGKTELARNLGRLLASDFQSVDCTSLRHTTDLFGTVSPFNGWKKGSVANNFLASHDGQRCIVFLDEFEKTVDEVRQTLLIPFDSGHYRNRRTLEAVDCSKTIWILATNAFDATIQQFCAKHQDALFDNPSADDAEANLKRLGRQLAGLIQKKCVSQFGAPLTGRITDFIPFLPFSPIEQAVVADQCLAAFGRELAGPVTVRDDPLHCRWVGNVDLEVRHAYAIAKALADEGYHQDLGARSLANTVGRKLRVPLAGQYLAAREEIREGQAAARFVVGVDADLGGLHVDGSDVRLSVRQDCNIRRPARSC
ncbi:P-loop containing nucleoside triphosphate hydrolase protein [Trichocladium antarcticum]|uniref:P-loop containing nucleoside triphosphate hydrolase protein n=1 Tax=Trichocladium antarcticum TaxID=1450529 RepID=A0AAN6UKF7_9PEZI|nr:P-loop containing nucleoside triphosphate hydrolase protein [Trichocladium antarcticum]